MTIIIYLFHSKLHSCKMKVAFCKLCWESFWRYNTSQMAHLLSWVCIAYQSLLIDGGGKIMMYWDWFKSLSAWESSLPALIQDLDSKHLKTTDNFKFLKRDNDPNEGVQASGFFDSSPYFSERSELLFPSPAELSEVSEHHWLCREPEGTDHSGSCNLGLINFKSLEVCLGCNFKTPRSSAFLRRVLCTT